MTAEETLILTQYSDAWEQFEALLKDTPYGDMCLPVETAILPLLLPAHRKDRDVNDVLNLFGLDDFRYVRNGMCRMESLLRIYGWQIQKIWRYPGNHRKPPGPYNMVLGYALYRQKTEPDARCRLIEDCNPDLKTSTSGITRLLYQLCNTKDVPS